MKQSLSLLVLFWGSSLLAEEVVRFDFESGDAAGFRVIDGKFDYFISDRDQFHNAYPERIYNKQGKYYFSTVEQQPSKPSNDRMTGVAESPVFVLKGPKMSMLVGSGTYPKTYVALCTLDGKEVRTARGTHHTEIMKRVEWNTPELVGKAVFLRIVDRETGGWGHVTFDDFTAVGHLDTHATQKRFEQLERQVARRRFEQTVQVTNLPALRKAILDLSETFGDRYPHAAEFLQNLDAIEQRLADPSSKDLDRLTEEIESLRRDALLSNPLLSEPILYVARNQYKQGGHHAIDTLFHTGEINTDRFTGPSSLKTLDLATGRQKTLVDVPDGLVRDPEVSFDGRRIVFALRRHIDEDYHIWEISADGTRLRQLTRAEGVSDFDPLYLPDGRIAFSSTREPKYNQCSRDIGANLFCMEADGANIHQLTKNNLFDNHGTLTPDGRILYARWEYVDRNFGDAHGLWTVNPDGTNPAVYWGNNTSSPGAVYYPRVLPGNPQQVVCVFGMHHNRLWGAMALVDRSRGIDGRPAVLRTWPTDAIERVQTGGRFDCDGFISIYPKYECPYPLSEKYFLCSRMTMRPNQTWIEGDARFGHEMGIYLVDVFGNELQVHVESPGCFDPMPLSPRKRPPSIASRRDFANRSGFFYVTDVYQGTHMRGVEPGSVKWLRVVQSPEKRHWSRGSWNGQGYTAPGMNWHGLENKRILGTVPVEADGSAYVEVPADRFVYFQLLDANGMMIQSMRSGTSVQSGEQNGCVGCHDSRLGSPPIPRLCQKSLLALRRSASTLNGWHGAPRDFSFMDEVQPVFDKHCTRCHDYGVESGKKLNLAPDRTMTFNTAYNELWRKGYVRCIGAGPAEVQPAYSWGSHASRLIQELRKPKVTEHRDVKLNDEELDRLITWVDLNGVYYGSYACAYPESLTGRCPLNHAQLTRLSQLTDVPFGSLRSHRGNRGPQISFARPELSPCLSKLTDHADANYREAVAIIEAGKSMLADHPRADMPGFKPCDVDQRREKKYAQRRQIELRNREAIRQGRKHYDP